MDSSSLSQLVGDEKPSVVSKKLKGDITSSASEGDGKPNVVSNKDKGKNTSFASQGNEKPSAVSKKRNRLQAMKDMITMSNMEPYVIMARIPMYSSSDDDDYPSPPLSPEPLSDVDSDTTYSPKPEAAA